MLFLAEALTKSKFPAGSSPSDGLFCRPLQVKIKSTGLNLHDQMARCGEILVDHHWAVVNSPDTLIDLVDHCHH